MNVKSKRQREEIRKEIELIQAYGRVLIETLGHDVRFACAEVGDGKEKNQSEQ